MSKSSQAYIPHGVGRQFPCESFVDSPLLLTLQRALIVSNHHPSSSNMIKLRSTFAVRSPLWQSRLVSRVNQQRLACSQSKVETACPSKAASTLPLSSTQFWASPSVWRRAGVNTARCLVGCTVGDFSAMWYLQSFHGDIVISSIISLYSKIHVSQRTLDDCLHV